MSKEFFTVTPVDQVLARIPEFATVDTQILPLSEACGRILAEDMIPDTDIPGFARATMDGYAVCAASTFGAGESNPAYLAICGRVDMGEAPAEPIGPGQAVRIATGGMLPPGADAVVMVEYTAEIDDTAIEVYKTVAPGTNVVAADEDYAKGRLAISAGTPIRPQEMGLLAAMGRKDVPVFQKPRIAVISTGDELVDISRSPAPGQVRDVNTWSLSGLITATGAEPVVYGIVPDDAGRLLETCRQALEENHMVLISGGSSVGMRDLTLEVIEALPRCRVLVHGIPIRPGKPTILAKAGEKALWGLPGQVTSAMVVFDRIVAPFIGHVAGNALFYEKKYRISAILSRNLPSAQGRTDYVRVRLVEKGGTYYAEPILGPAGLIRTMIAADGLIEIDMHTEGLEEGEPVQVIPMRA